MVVAEDWGMCVCWGSNDFVDWSMVNWGRFVYNSVESIVVISGVINGTD